MIELMYRAVGEPIGLLLTVADPDRARQRFYQLRKELAEPAFSNLQFRRIEHPEKFNLAITKQVGFTVEELGL